MPVSLSGRMVRMSRGRASSAPACTLARPDKAWMMGSYTGLWANGPVSPQPLMDT